MKSIILFILLLIPTSVLTQDLELDVHVLPPAQLGDQAAFNIKVRNTGEEPAEGIRASISIGKGLAFISFIPPGELFDPQSGTWSVGDLAKAQSKVLTIMVTYTAREDAILAAEVSECLSTDPDSTPGNGIDTNGNGQLVADKGDEDDGDAAQIGPFKQ
jgi:uncharacterized repeat protein (TIGR01451 family)